MHCCCYDTRMVLLLVRAETIEIVASISYFTSISKERPQMIHYHIPTLLPTVISPPPPSSRTGWGLTTFSFRRGASQDELPLRGGASCLLLLHLNQCTNRIQGIICRLLSRRLAISHAVLQLRVIE